MVQFIRVLFTHCSVVTVLHLFLIVYVSSPTKIKAWSLICSLSFLIHVTTLTVIHNHNSQHCIEENTLFQRLCLYHTTVNDG